MAEEEQPVPTKDDENVAAEGEAPADEPAPPPFTITVTVKVRVVRTKILGRGGERKDAKRRRGARALAV